MCSHVVSDGSAPQVKGLIYLGFPLHAPGKDGTSRARHLQQVKIPQLFLQGSNDKLARLDLIKQVVKEQAHADLHVIDHADHSFRVPKKHQKPDFIIMEALVKKANDWALSVVR